MIVKTGIAFTGIAAALTLSLTGPANATPSVDDGPQTSATTDSNTTSCTVDHGAFYSGPGPVPLVWFRYVDVYNSCYTKAWVCVGIVGQADAGPFGVAARSSRTINYGDAVTVKEGSSLYYAQGGSSDC